MIQAVSTRNAAITDSDSIAWGHSIEAEQSVLGGLLLDNSAYDRVADLVVEADFFSGDHRLIFRATIGLIENNRPADALTVADALERLGRLKDMGGRAYLGNLAMNTPSAANIRRYAEIVVERSIMRSLYRASQSIIESVMNSKGREIGDLLDSAQALIMSIREKKVPGHSDFESLHHVMAGVVDFVDTQHARYEAGEINEVTGLPTGFIDLDRMTSGLHPGQLIILAARPAMGKSALSLNISEYAAKTSKKPVVFFTMEMGNREQGLRMLASGARINTQRLVTGRLNNDEWERIVGAVDAISDCPIVLCEQGGLSIGELRALARRAKREYSDLGLVVVDYLQLMVGGDSEANRSAQLSEISRGLKLLAKELNVPVIALSQLNRELEKRPNKRPVMSDLRDSGAIEQDADMILFIYRDEVYHQDSPYAGTAEIIVAKQRNGPTGTVRLTFRKDHTRFENYAVSP